MEGFLDSDRKVHISTIEHKYIAGEGQAILGGKGGMLRGAAARYQLCPHCFVWVLTVNLLAAADGIVSSEEQGSVDTDPLKPPEESPVKEPLEDAEPQEEPPLSCW